MPPGNRETGRPMLSLKKYHLLGLCVAVASASPAMAQQRPGPSAPTEILSCDAFAKNNEGDWVTKKDTTVSGVSVLARGGNSAMSARRAECPIGWSPARA